MQIARDKNLWERREKDMLCLKKQNAKNYIITLTSCFEILIDRLHYSKITKMHKIDPSHLLLGHSWKADD